MIKFSSHKSKKKDDKPEREEDNKTEQIFMSMNKDKLELDEVDFLMILRRECNPQFRQF